MDEKIINDFSQKLDIFLESFSGISKSFLEKLESLNANACELVDNTEFLKKLKTKETEEQQILQNIEDTVKTLLTKLDQIKRMQE